MRGASALDQALKSRPGDDVRVFVVWEPVLATDIAPPSSDELARCRDVRARQYWDQDRLVSEALRDSAKGPKWRDVVWDYVAVFPPGTRWDSGARPNASYEGGPVIEVIRDVEAQLANR